MSTKYLRELLESIDVLNPERACEGISEALQELRQVEADRAKDAELIQQLVHHINNARNSGNAPFNSVNDIALWQALKEAEAAGFKPSDR